MCPPLLFDLQTINTLSRSDSLHSAKMSRLIWKTIEPMTPDCIIILVPIITSLGVSQQTNGARPEVRNLQHSARHV